MRAAAIAIALLLAIGVTVGANVSAYIAWITYTVLPSSGAQRISVTSIPSPVPHAPGPLDSVVLAGAPLVVAIAVLVVCVVVVRRSPR